MARTAEQITAEIEALRAQRANPAAATRVGDVSLEYRGEAGIDRSIAALERELRQLRGRRSIRTLNVHVDTGL